MYEKYPIYSCDNDFMLQIDLFLFGQAVVNISLYSAFRFSEAETPCHNLGNIFLAFDWWIFIGAIQASDLCFPVRIIKKCNRTPWCASLEFLFWNNDPVNLYKCKISGYKYLVRF